MNKNSLKFLICGIIFGVVFGVCPNNCSGHGTCKNNVCECQQNVGVLSGGGSYSTYSWVGSDCSKKSCGIDTPLFAVTDENDYANRQSDDGNLPLRELSSSNVIRRLSSEIKVTTAVKIVGTTFYEVTVDNAAEITKVGGKLYYYDENSKWLGSCELFCNSGKAKCFMKYSKDENYTPSTYTYILILEYNDYSLIYDKVDPIETKAIVWKNMGYIVYTLGITTYNFECTGSSGEVVFTSNEPVDSTQEDPQDITFTTESQSLTGCSLLGIASADIPSDRSKIDKITAEVTDVKLNMEGKEIQIYKIADEKGILKIPISNVGVLECITPFSTTSKAYLMNVETGNTPTTYYYYIAYNFTFGGDKPIPTDYRCEEKIKYGDLTYYFPVDIDVNSNTCTITWSVLRDVISSSTSLIKPPADSTIFSFACKDDKNIVKIYDGFTYSGTTFTKASCDIPKGKYTCYILANVGSSQAITPLDTITGTYLEKNYLTVSKSTGILTYESIKDIDSTNKIYSIPAANYNVGISGGTLECYGGSNKKYEAKILRKQGDVAIVTSSQKPINTDICKMTIKHSDLSLYNPVKIESPEHAISWSDIYKYLADTNFIGSKDKYSKYQFACDNDKTITIRNSTRTIVTTPESSNSIDFTCKDCVKDEMCYLLSYSDGSPIKDIFESDLSKIFKLTKSKDGVYTYTTNIKFKDTTKTVTTPITAKSAKPIYEMSGEKYDIGKSGALLSCFKSDNTFVSEVQIIGLKDDNTYYVTISNTIADLTNHGIDHCDVLMKMNDISTINELTCSGDNQPASPCTITYPDSGLGLFDKKFISSKKTTSHFICGGDKTDGQVFKDYVFTLEEGAELKYTNADLSASSICYLSANVDGKDVDIKNSDIYKLQLDDDNKYIDSTKDIILGKFIYRIKGVNYDIGKYGGKIICGGEIKTIIGKVNDVYYIRSTDVNTQNLRDCKLVKKYNDLSLFTTSSYLLSTYIKTNTPVNVVCHKDANSIKITTELTKVTTVTTSDANIVELTFDPTIDSGCSMLYGENGNIELKDSDYRYEYLKDNPSEWKYNTEGIIKEEVEIVKAEDIESLKSIVKDIPEIGGTLKCYDSEGNELGTAIVYSNLNGVLNIEYTFPQKAGSDESKYQFEIISKNKDLSTNVIKVKEENCKDIDACEIIWKGVGPLLLSKGFFDNFGSSSSSSPNSLSRLLSPTYIDLPCADPKSGIVSNFTFLSEIIGNDVVLSDAQPKSPVVGSQCFPLFNSEAKPISLSESVIGNSAIVDENGIVKIPSAVGGNKGDLSNDDINSGIISKIGKNSNGEYIITTYPCATNIIKQTFENLKMLIFSPITDKDTLNEIKQYLSVGSWITVTYLSKSTLINSQILNIDYNVKIEYDNITRTRQLAAIPHTFWGLKLSNFGNIDCSSGCTITKSKDLTDIHKKLECSGQGSCDRETGICNCFDGFSGSYCQRLDCPNNCNGNGRCVALSELLNNDDLKYYNSEIDKERIYGCLCDKRHRGHDCSLIECPSGKDPEGATNAKDGDDEMRDCSGRGICNYNTGICECFDGFSGEGCQNQAQMM